MIKKTALVLLMCLFTVGCSQSAASLLPFMDPAVSNKTDLEGKTYYIASDVQPSESMHETFFSYGATTQNYDNAIARFNEVQKKLNCNLKFTTPVGSRDMLLAAAAEKPIDMIVHPIYYGGMTDIMSGIYTPISDIAAIDYKNSDKWGSPNMLELFCYNDELYGVIPAAWPDGNIMSLDFLMVINEPMVERNAMTDPRDLFEQGQWTHDNFLDTVSRFYNTDNPDNIVYGFSGNDRHFFDMTLKSFGVDFVIKNGDVYENGYMTEEFVTAYEWASNFIAGDYAEMSIFEGMDCVQHWVNDMTGIAMVHMNYLCSMGGDDSSSDIVLADKEYGLVPFPSMDGKTIHAQYERVINGIMFSSWRVTNDDMGVIANALFEPFEGIETIEDQKANLNTNLFFDERDTNLIFNMITEAKYLFHDEGINDLHAEIKNTAGKKSGTQVQQEYQTKLDTIIAEYIQNARSSYENIFGE